MNREGEKDTLITSERALLAQADLRIVRGSTIERKQMSTKTTFKRVALVAVAALGLGLLSVAPSNAYTQADTLTVSSATAAVLITDTATATSAPTTTVAFLANATLDSMTVTASLVSAPATATALPYLQLSDSVSATVKKSDNTALAVGSAQSPNGAAYVWTTGGTTGTRVSATFKVYLSADGVAGPTVAGTYVVKITPSVLTGSGTVNATAQTITFTVTAPDTTAVSAYTHLLMTNGTSNATTYPVVGQADSTTSGSLVAGTRIGSVGVALLNAAASAVSESYTATITGAGTLGSGATNGNAAGSVVGRSITVKSGNDVFIYADGTGGVGTITISSAAGKTLATKSVQFYGDPSTIVLSSNSNAVVGTLSAPVKATVYDKNGYLVKGAAVYATSADTTVITASYAGPYTTAADGTVSIPLTGAKLGTAKITVGLASSATDVTTTGYTVKSDALTVTVGGSANQQAGVVVTTDKQIYAPGSYAYVTVKAVDSAGKTLSPLPSGTYTVFATGGISGSLPFDTVTGIISSVGFTPAAKAGTATSTDPIVAQAGEYVYKIKLPSYSGDFTLGWTTAAASNFPGNIAAGGVAGSLTVSLSDPGSQAAVDAAAEATDAANAATDAALAAADAADAATMAAQDASDAVAALSASVSKLIASLKAQITTLTNLVIKIQKKVKA
jgi:hypothetical protein